MKNLADLLNDFTNRLRGMGENMEIERIRRLALAMDPTCRVNWNGTAFQVTFRDSSIYIDAVITTR